MDVDLGASGAGRWMVCTASPGFLAKHKDELPDDSSRYATEGTEAHLHAAASLIMGFDKKAFPSRDMAQHVEGYTKMVFGWATLPGSILHVESVVPLFYNNQRRGLIDACVVSPDPVTRWRIFIGDLKYGAGVSVQAVENEQLTIYGWSLILQLWVLFDFLDETPVTLMIYQPRILGEPAVRLWEMTLGELRTRAEAIGAVAARIYALAKAGKPTGEFAPSDETCKFCKGVSLCASRAGHLLGGGLPAETLELMPEAKQIVLSSLFPEPSAIPAETLARIVFHAPALKEWLEKCQAAGASRLHIGKDFPGFKLVTGRGGNRQWEHPAAAEKVLRELLPEEDLLTVPKLRSPAQVEEALKVREAGTEAFEAVKRLTIKPEGKPTMVPLDDKRKDYRVEAASIFDNLETDSSMLD